QQNSSDYIVAGWNGLHILSNDGGVGAGIDAGKAATDGNWHHLAMTWKRNTANGFASYLDGKLVATRKSSDSAIPNLNAQVFFGAFNGNGEPSKGQLDEIAIWNRALSPAEILGNLHTGLQGNEPGLIGYWNFDDGVGNDLTSNGNNAELRNNATIVPVTNLGLGNQY